MSDGRLRELERRIQAGDENARAQLLVEQSRTGALPVIPRCPNCDTSTYARENDLKSHAKAPCPLCPGTGDLPGFDRIVLAAFAGDEIARAALGGEPYSRIATNPAKPALNIPGGDTYDWEPFLDAVRTHFGPVAAIAAVIGAARAHFDAATIAARDWSDEWEHHVNDALVVFETWIKEPTSSNLVKLAGRSDYGGTFQRLFEGCDALASRHRRGGVIFWEGAREFARRYNSDVPLDDRLRLAAAAWARSGCW